MQITLQEKLNFSLQLTTRFPDRTIQTFANIEQYWDMFDSQEHHFQFKTSFGQTTLWTVSKLFARTRWPDFLSISFAICTYNFYLAALPEKDTNFDVFFFWLLSGYTICIYKCLFVWLCGYAKCEEISAFPGAKSFAMQPAAKGYINTFSFSLQTSRKRNENFSTRTLLEPPVSLRIFFFWPRKTQQCRLMDLCSQPNYELNRTWH